MGILNSISKIIDSANTKDDASVLKGSALLFGVLGVASEVMKLSNRTSFDESMETLYNASNKEGISSGSLWQAVKFIRDTNELSPLGEAIVESQIGIAYNDAYLYNKAIMEEESFDNLPANEQDKIRNDSLQHFDIALNSFDEAIDHLGKAEPDQFREFALSFYLMKFELVNSRYGLLWDVDDRLEAVRIIINLLQYSDNSEINARAHFFLQNFNEHYNCYAIALQPKEGRLKSLNMDHENDLKWLREQVKMDDAQKAEALEIINSSYQNNVDEVERGLSTFTNHPYLERQFIFIVRDAYHMDGCYDETDTVKYVFPMDGLPGDITFPIGHPQANTLYYAHPHRPYYMPFELAKEEMFNEYVQDLIRLFQSLGAENIILRQLKGYSSSQTESTISNIGIGATIKNIGGSISNSINRSQNIDQTSSKFSDIQMEFSPNKEAYVPDDLNWLKNNYEIARFIQNRLDGNMLHYEKKVTTSESMNISSSQMVELKVAFENFMANVSSDVSQSVDLCFNESENKELQIIVNFASLSNLRERASSADENSDQESILSKLSIAETQYLEEVQFMLEDGLIGPTERRLLERKRERLGISPERAIEIESTFIKPKLTNEESEYLELYKEYLEAGQITDRVRKILNREASSLGISSDRLAEIESSSK